MTIAIVAHPARLRAAAGQPHSLKVGGLTPCSPHAFPGRQAAVVFVQGCAWQCGYCHNPHLQLRLPQSPLAWSRVLQVLDARAGSIDAVLFSGGEPTLDPALPDAIRDVRALGLAAGVHTAGSHPERLDAVLPFLDWVTLDIKAPFDSYEKVTGVPDSGADVQRAVRHILARGTPHEFRTTVHPNLLDESDLARIGQDLAALGARNLVLQAFRPQGCRNKALRKSAVEGFPGADVVERLAGLLPEVRLQAA